MRTLHHLDDAGRHFRYLRVSCRRCGHTAMFQIDDLIKALGNGRSPHRLPMKCTVCGETKPAAEFCDAPNYPKDRFIWKREVIPYRR